MISTGVFQWLFIVFGLSIWITYTSSKEIRVVCYYTNWSVYRPGTAKFSPQNINPYLCTHLVYAFGGFTKENTLKPFDKYQDIEKGGYAKFTGLKTYNKNLKTLLAIGGWNEASSRFSPMVASPDRRKQLVKNSIKFLRQNHFDGLDLDWEYPAFREGGKPRDKDNYAKLVQELREEFERESEKTGRPRLLLTMAVPAGIEYINKGYDIPKLTKYLDWMNILSYDYHSAFEPAVNHHAPLYPMQEEATEYDYDVELNIDYTIKHYLELGADPSKLVVGIPTYGRSYTLYNPDANAIGDPADGPGEMGEATRENGYLAYYEICENVKSNDWTVVQPNEKAMGPYAYKENQWVGYDDENIARRKAEYVSKNGLGGIMFWAIDNDDFRGNCHGRPYPLIEAAKEALISAYGLTDDNLISPPAKSTKSKNRHRSRPKTTENPSSDAFEETTKSTNVSRRRNKTKTKANARTSGSDDKSSARKETRKTENTSTYSSLKVVTPAYTTPEPPSTPDQGGAFKCEDEGFFPHPKDCKKYFWCLSGPGELGIVAHQFTCPAGLYFNKAADSCDYSQNVLCNKKLSKTATTTKKSVETTEKTTTTQKTSTRATTKRPTSQTTTTTEESYDDEYEYEDDEVNDPKLEEDPKVIKELLNLIKKAGGIEELEKQLNRGYGESKTGATTPSTRTKSIVEKLLTSRNSASDRNRYSTINRNSRGPQNEGLKAVKDSDEISSRQKADRKPQYTSIQRRRPSTPKTELEDDELDEDEDEEQNEEKPSSPRYTSIRRSKGSTTTEGSINRQQLDRNKILGEEDKDTEDSNRREVTVHTTPQYVNIRRQRPSTTEEASTSKYVSIRRSTTIAAPTEENEEEVTRSSSRTTDATTVSQQTSSLRYQIINRHGTSTLQASSSTQRSSTSEIPSTEAISSTRPDPEESYTTSTPLTRSEIESTSLETSTTTTPKTASPAISSTEPEVQTTKSPILLEPRPFSFEPTISTTQKPQRQIFRLTTSPSKVSETTIRSRFRTKSNSDKILNNKVISDNSVELGTDNINSGRPLRTRVRFTAPDSLRNEASTRSSSPSFRQRTRPSTTQRITTDREEDEIQRKYRPIGLDDLSSLTAADISIQQNNRGAAFRRTRLRTTTVEPLSEEGVNTNTTPNIRSRTIGRSKSSFSNRSNISRKNDIADQVKSNTDEIAITRQEQNEITPSSTEFNRRAPKRTRKVLRRLRPSTSEPSSTLATPVTRRGRPFSYSSLNLGSTSEKSRNLIINDGDSNEANISEESAEEDENIKLSATNIRENSNANNDNVIFDRKYGRTNKADSLFEKSQYGSKSSTTTESSLARTRKIIRRLRPTQSTILETQSTEAGLIGDERSVGISGNNPGRTRKIIRRLRPNLDTASSKEPQEFINKAQVPQFYEKKPLFSIRGRSNSGKNFSLKPRSTTESIVVPTTHPTFLNRYQQTYNDIGITRETSTDISSRGSLRFKDIVGSTTPSYITYHGEDFTKNEDDDATSSLSTQFVTTLNDDLEKMLTTLDNFITNEETSSTQNTEYNDITTTAPRDAFSEKAETLNTVGSLNGDATTSSNSLSYIDDVTTISYLQASRNTDVSTEAATGTDVMEESSTVPVLNETGGFATDLTTSNDITTVSPTTTTEYIRKSTLRTSRLRPTYLIRRKTTSTTTDASISSTEENKRSSFARRKPIFRPKSTSDKATSSENISEKPKRRYPFSKNGRTRISPTNDSSKEKPEDENIEVTEQPSSVKPRLKFYPNRNKTATSTEPYRPEVTTEGEITKSIFESSTDPSTTKINSNDKQRLRNKALFSKKRKMNIPAPSSAELKEEQTTEHPTTLYHVFAEPEVNENETNTITKNETHINAGGKIERIVEINRIIQVHVKNGDDNKNEKEEEEKGIVDKIGAINRVTSINVVDSNGTNISTSDDSFLNAVNSQKQRAIDQTNQRLAVVHDIIEQERKSQRKDRKFESNINNDPVNGLKNEARGAEIIDGISHIKVITPRPILLSEVSTIALEGLFSTDKTSKSTEDPNVTTPAENELLDVEHSRFVNIRILKPGDARSLDDGVPADTPMVARVLPNDEEVTMKAKVVEVTPRNGNQTIRIAPIQVSMARAIADIPIVGLKKLNERISNTPFRSNVDSGVP